MVRSLAIWAMVRVPVADVRVPQCLGRVPDKTRCAPGHHHDMHLLAAPEQCKERHFTWRVTLVFVSGCVGELDTVRLDFTLHRVGAHQMWAMISRNRDKTAGPCCD